MNAVQDLKVIEQAVAAADQRALAMLSIASDPAGTRKRLDELSAATKAHDAAKAAAEAAEEAAQGWKAKADEALAAMAEKIKQFQDWSEGTERQLKQRQASVESAEAALVTREQNLKNKEADLAERLTEHENVLERLRLHLGKAGV